MKRDSGVYAIHGVYGRCYVGATKDLHTRWTGHKSQLRRGIHRSHSLQRDWDRHGGKWFSFAVLERCSIQRLIEREHFWCERLRADTCGYSRYAGTSKGYHHTAKARRRMRRARVDPSRKKPDAWRWDDDKRQRYVPWNKGTTCSEPMSIEHRRKISLGQKRRWRQRKQEAS
jgi:group I intron endonuclease